MEAAAKFTELFILTFCTLLAPADSKDLSVTVIAEKAPGETVKLVAKNGGWDVTSYQDDFKRVIMRIEPAKDGKNVMLVQVLGDGAKEPTKIDLSQAAGKLQLPLGDKQEFKLDGGGVTVTPREDVVFLSFEGVSKQFLVHGLEGVVFKPTSRPIIAPTPVATPSPRPTAVPTPLPTPRPTAAPAPTRIPLPTPLPTGVPTATPRPLPTAFPTGAPTPAPTTRPTMVPTSLPTSGPHPVDLADMRSPTQVARDFWEALAAGDTDKMADAYGPQVTIKANSELLWKQWGVSATGDRSKDLTVPKEKVLAGYKALIAGTKLEKWQTKMGKGQQPDLFVEYAEHDGDLFPEVRKGDMILKPSKAASRKAWVFRKDKSKVWRLIVEQFDMDS